MRDQAILALGSGSVLISGVVSVNLLGSRFANVRDDARIALVSVAVWLAFVVWVVARALIKRGAHGTAAPDA